MSAPGPDCRHARLHIGAEPQSLPPDVVVHVEGCASCRQFRDEMRMLDGQLRSALELPLNRFRQPAAAVAPVAAPSRAPRRRFALAASVALAVVVSGSLWLLRPQTALASEVMSHVREEMYGFDGREPVAPDTIAATLKAAGVQFESDRPVVYAMLCSFRGHDVAHFVVQTASGPLTVLLLPHEPVGSRREFHEEGLQGVLLPSGDGSVAVLSRDTAIPADLAADIVSGARW